MKPITQLLGKKRSLCVATKKPAWREGYFSRYSICLIFPHFTYFFLNQGGLPLPGKGGPGLPLPVIEQDVTQEDFLPPEPTMSQPVPT